MSTPVLDAADPRSVATAAVLLRAGDLVAFPTETVYGLGALGLDARAVERIFAAKGRPHSDPLILHVAGTAMTLPLVRDLPPVAAALMEQFWPGPLTLVLRRAACVPDLVTAGRDSVAIRMPAHPVALALIGAVGEPLAAPSANLFGRTSPTTAQHVLQDLEGRIAAVLDGGPSRVGVESTVLDVRGGTPVILRPGGVSREELESALGTAVGARGDETGGPRSPGLLTQHYSPRARIFLFHGEDAPLTAAVRDLLGQPETPCPVAALAFTEDMPRFAQLGVRAEEIGSRARLEEVAQRLYAALRRVDAEGAAAIVVRTAPAGGLGEAINDRLLRAAAGRLIEL